MNLLKTIIATVFLSFADMIVGQVSPITPDISLLARDFQVCLWVAFAYQSFPKNKIQSRTISFIFFLLCASESFQYFVFYYTGYNSYATAYFIFIILGSSFFVLNKFKEYSYQSDRIDPNGQNVYLCFWKPKNTRSLLGSIFGLPFGGMSIYTNYVLWGYRWGESSFRPRQVDPCVIQREFFVHDTGIKTSQEIIRQLKSAYGSKAGFLRVRCIYTIRGVLSLLGPKYKADSILKLIPSVYLKGIL